MLSIFATAAACAAPSARADGSLKWASSVVFPTTARAAGEGVDGTFMGGPDAGPGAAGGAGV